MDGRSAGFRKRVLLVLLVVALGIGLLLWWDDTEDPDSHAADREAASGEAGTPSGLVPGGSPPREAPAADDAEGPREPDPPAPEAPEPKAPGASSPEAPTVVMDLRLQHELPDGTVKAVELTEVFRRGKVHPWETLPVVPGGLSVRPGEEIAVLLDFSAAMSEGIRLRVPDPVPKVMTVEVFVEDDPRFQEMLIEVVDAVTGAPLPDAALEWMYRDAPAFQAADHRGRILVRAAAGTRDSVALLLLHDHGFCIHAPGYQPYPRPGGPDLGPCVDGARLAAWCDSGIHRVALQPRPGPKDVTRRTVRILDADGNPVAGAYVLVCFAVSREAASASLPESRDGFRRTDAYGDIRVPTPRVVGIEVRIRNVPVAAWGLSEDAWPETGPRELRLPEIAEAELLVEAIPGWRSGTWRCDRLGWKRTLADGPAVAPQLDPAAAALLAKHGALLPVRMEEASGSLSCKKATIRLPLVVGSPQTLYLRMESHEKAWTVTPDRKGEWRAKVKWSDLPDA